MPHHSASAQSAVDGHSPVDLVAEHGPLGGLQRWLDDPAVDEVMVNRGGEVWVDRGGRLDRVGTMRTATLLAVVEHLLVHTGRRLDRLSPMVDARLPDGSRVCAAIEPIAVDGPCLALRRFPHRVLPLERFASAPVAALLEALIAARANVVVSGATSSGKTSLLAALVALLPAHERLVTLEDTAELPVRHPHVVRLETRDATPDGTPAITLADLLRTALRLRPDRLIVGEVRGGEAVHLLQALNTGHDGSMATLHANGAADALARLSTLVLQAAPTWPLAAVREHVVRAVDAVVHLERQPDGRRAVVEVVEVGGGADGIEVTALAGATAVLRAPARCRR